MPDGSDPHYNIRTRRMALDMLRYTFIGPCEYLMGRPERPYNCPNRATFKLTFAGQPRGVHQKLCDFHAGRIYETMVPRPVVIKE